MSETGNLLGEAASLDPAIRERVINLATMALDHAEFLMKHGDPQMKSKLISSFLTTFSKHMRTQETNEEINVLREQLTVLTQAVLGHKPGELDGTDGEDGAVPIPGELVPMDNPPA